MVCEVVRESDFDSSDFAHTPGIEGLRESQALESHYWWFIEVLRDQVSQCASGPLQMAPIVDLVWKSPDVDGNDEPGYKIYHVVAAASGKWFLSSLA